MKGYKQLNLKERLIIWRLREKGESVRRIAHKLGREASTISRELRRNSKEFYLPEQADKYAASRSHREFKLQKNDSLRKKVIEKLHLGWSPEQISGRMKLQAEITRICAESIYRYIYANPDGKTLAKLLPQRRPVRRKRYSRKKRIGGIPQRVSIHQRPDIVGKFGHWEGDLMIFSKQRNNLLTMVEKTTRLTLISKNDNKKKNTIRRKMMFKLKDLPENQRKTMTLDNGGEFAGHTWLQNIGISTYFCDAYSPWQKGAVENANARIRRFLPRSVDLGRVSWLDICRLEDKLNNTPRKCLGFKTPNEAWNEKINQCCT